LSAPKGFEAWASFFDLLVFLVGSRAMARLLGQGSQATNALARDVFLLTREI
jgi:hypothetical protein